MGAVNFKPLHLGQQSNLNAISNRTHPLTALTSSNPNSACGNSNSPVIAEVLRYVSIDATRENQLHHITALYNDPSWRGYKFRFVFGFNYSLAVTCCIVFYSLRLTKTLLRIVFAHVKINT